MLLAAVTRSFDVLLRPSSRLFCRFVRPYVERHRTRATRDQEIAVKQVLLRGAQGQHTNRLDTYESRKNKMSLEARLATPEGRTIMHRRLVRRKFPLAPYND